MRPLLLCLAVCAASVLYAQEDCIVAFVGQKPVLESEIQNRMRVDRCTSSQALQGLIDEKLLLIEAERVGITVSDVDVRKEEMAIRRQFPDNAAFLQNLAREGLTLPELRRRIRERLLIKQLVNDQVYRQVVVSMPELMRESAEVARELGTEYRLLGKDFPDRESAEVFVQNWTENRMADMQDLGWIKQAELLPQIAAAVADLSERVPSKPVLLTRWHVFCVRERRMVPVPEEKVRETARARVWQRAYDARFAAFLADLRKKTPVTVIHE